MDVKSKFLNGPIQELAYVEQPPDFEDHKFPNHVYKLQKMLYGLKQAPRAWYECLKKFLLKQGFEIGEMNYKNINIMLKMFYHKKQVHYDHCLN